MKKKHIILIILFAVIANAALVFMIILPKLGYSSPENAMWLNPSIQCYEIYDKIESGDCILVVYKGSSATKSQILYKSNGRYFVFDYDTSSIIFENTVKGLIAVREVDDEYTIEVHSIHNKKEPQKVVDSLGSVFEYRFCDYGSSSSHKWFLAMDEIPENYCIYLDDLKVTVPAQNN